MPKRRASGEEAGSSASSVASASSSVTTRSKKQRISSSSSATRRRLSSTAAAAEILSSSFGSIPSSAAKRRARAESPTLGKRARRGEATSSSSRSSSATGLSGSAPRKRSFRQQRDQKPAKSKPGRKPRVENGYVVEVVFENPQDALDEPPPRPARPTRLGETIADAIFFGDDLIFGAQGKEARLFAPLPERLRDRLLRAGLRPVSDGLVGRTTVFDHCADPVQAAWMKPEFWNGLKELGTTISMHTPQWLVLSLGTHDLRKGVRDLALAGKRGANSKKNCTPQAYAEIVASNLKQLVQHAAELFKGHCHDGALKVCLVVPPPLKPSPEMAGMGFDAMAFECQPFLTKAFKEMARKLGENVIVVSLDQLALHQERWCSGLHPDDEDADLIADHLWRSIQAFAE